MSIGFPRKVLGMARSSLTWWMVFCSLGAVLSVSTASEASLAEYSVSLREKFTDVRVVSTDELAGLLENTAARPILLDARKENEFTVSHLPGAHRIEPNATVQLERLGVGKHNSIVVYCSVGYRSALLVRELQEAGFTQVRNLDGSIFAWANEDRPLVNAHGPTRGVHPFDTRWGRYLDKSRWHWEPDVSANPQSTHVLLHVLWDTHGYLFWLLVISAGCLVAERIKPWRRGQKLFRKEFFQDLFLLFFNGHYFAVLFAYVTAFCTQWLFPVIAVAKSWNLLGGQSIVLQALTYFLLKDFLDWCVHNLLHRVPGLWKFHKLHHSIVEMDWIGNFRFHWMEIVVYQGLTYFPLVILGADPLAILLVALAATLIGHLNHSNLDITWGPLRYLFNSSRMHIWHHMYHLPENRLTGVNFGISLSLWDWLFRTAYWPTPQECPTQQPRNLGFRGMETFPHSLPARLFIPLVASSSKARVDNVADRQ